MFGVIGSGSIGPDLAYAFANAVVRDNGTVFLHDIKEEQLNQGMRRIEGYITKAVSRGKLTPEAGKAVLGAIKPTLALGDLAACNYVLEAASENLGVKRQILVQLEEVVSPDCLIGFATSGLCRSLIIEGAKHPDRCFVNHPFYPAWRALPIELVESDDEDLSKKMFDLLVRLGKVPIVVGDVACFAADDIFCNYEAEAVRILQDGVANPYQIDRIVNEAIGGGGPFLVHDLTRGNQLTCHCLQLMQEAHEGNQWFTPPRLLVEQGSKPWLDPKNSGSSDYDEATKQKVLDRILAVLLGRTLWVLDRDICDAGDLDWLTRNALGFKTGLLSLAQKLGQARVTELCENYAESYPGFEVPENVDDEGTYDFCKNATIDFASHDNVAVITIRRPEVLNAINAETVRELAEYLTFVEELSEVKGVIINSLGGALAGADINELAALKTQEECEKMCGPGQALTMQIEQMSKPTVVVLNGPVLGGGCELAMSCWARVIGPKTIVGQPEVNLGIIPGYGGTQRLPRLVGLPFAMQMLRTGAPINAKKALENNWANVLCDDPMAEAFAVILRHLEGKATLKPMSHEPMTDIPEFVPAIDIGHHSQAIDEILVGVVCEGLKLPLAEGLKAEARCFGRCRKTCDMAIGMANFMQNGPKIPAEFVNA